jgi:hypothetical protein
MIQSLRRVHLFPTSDDSTEGAMDQLSSELLGFAPDARVLIVNCDDFGMHDAVNAAVVESIENGIASSCSLMVPCPAAANAMWLLRERPHIRSASTSRSSATRPSIAGAPPPRPTCPRSSWFGLGRRRDGQSHLLADDSTLEGRDPRVGAAGRLAEA